MLDSLDPIMTERELDWIVARGDGGHSANVNFLLGGARVGHVTALKKRGEPVHCVVGVMERDEARRAGLNYSVPNDYDHTGIMELGLDPIETSARYLAAILKKHEVQGRVAFVGSGTLQGSYAVMRRLLEALPQIQFVEEPHGSAVGRARFTKSPGEIDRIRSVARRTEQVVEHVLGILRACTEGPGHLLRADGSPLKIGHVKDEIRVELARRGLTDHGQTIFACGREAGFPHSRGDEKAEVLTNRTIIFDIFPQELGGGVFYDMTRTYWIGEVPETVTKAYRAVEEAFEKTAAEARAGQPTRDLDALCCDVLEGHGYVTKRTDPKTEVGYMHSLGHGVGLEIHERPWVSTRKVNQDVFEVGQVFTIEPGLYYPDEGFGMRIEDTFVIEPGGRAQTLSALPRNPRITL